MQPNFNNSTVEQLQKKLQSVEHLFRCFRNFTLFSLNSVRGVEKHGAEQSQTLTPSTLKYLSPFSFPNTFELSVLFKSFIQICKKESHTENAIDDKANHKQNKWYTWYLEKEWPKSRRNGLSNKIKWCKCIENVYKGWGAKNFAYNSYFPNTLYQFFHEFLLNLQNHN